jgi:hypothetical protein
MDDIAVDLAFKCKKAAGDTQYKKDEWQAIILDT